MKNTSLKMNTKTGQVYIGNMSLHQDSKGYYTISTTVFMKKKIQIRNDIKDIQLIEKINAFCSRFLCVEIRFPCHRFGK